jgi:hypothetical protein
MNALYVQEFFYCLPCRHEAVSPAVSGAVAGANCSPMYLCKNLLSGGRSYIKSCLSVWQICMCSIGSLLQMN